MYPAAFVRWLGNIVILAVPWDAAFTTVAPSIIGTALSVMTDAVRKVGLVLAGGRLHGWHSMSQLRCVAALIDRRPRQACQTLLWPWQRDNTLGLLPSVVLDRRIGPSLRFNPGAGGGAVWTLGPTVQVCGRLRPVGFCDLAIAIVTTTTMLR